ncbi:MAG: hypothetical protein KZQ63_00215 [Candidatus Thiodiazotropha sp. (ex Lucinoma aequizonata)]|nr:hypothetical protein [Candidatus Thiodiazotropha sp. (ex Lucinoma aequizonata)]
MLATRPGRQLVYARLGLIEDLDNGVLDCNYSDEHPITVSPGANQRGEALLSPVTIQQPYI